PPVGGIGDVRDAGKSIETDVVVARVTRQQTPRALTQRDRALKPAFERLHRAARRLQELTDLAVAHWVARIAPALYFAETMMERLDEQAATFGIVDQIVLQIRIALHDPDVAEHFEEHPCRPARAAFGPQLVEHLPDVLAQQPHDDLTIGERRVVVRNLTEPGRGIGGNRAFRPEGLERKRQVLQGSDPGRWRRLMKL